MKKILLIAKEVAIGLCVTAVAAASAVGGVLFVKHKLNNAGSSSFIGANASGNISFSDLGRDEPTLNDFDGKEYLCVDIFEKKEDEGSCFYIQLVKDYPTSLGLFCKDKDCETKICGASSYAEIVGKFDTGVFKVERDGAGKIKLKKQKSYVGTLRGMHGDLCQKRFVAGKLIKALQQIKITKE